MYISDIFNIPGVYLSLYVGLFMAYHKYVPIVHSAKYFVAHAVHNILVMYYTYYVIQELLKDPLMEDNNYYSYVHVPYKFCSLLGALHVYHMLISSHSILKDEIYHHVLSVYFHFFSLNNYLLASLFFMTGLPGGITYILLTLVKYKLIGKLTEKVISKHLNLWCRLPGILFFTSLLALNIYNKYVNNLPIYYQDYITFGFMFWNPIHFTHTIIVSYENAKRGIAQDN